MSGFSDIISELKQLAQAEWAKIEAEGKIIEQRLEPVLEDGFAQAVKDFGQLAMSLVADFAQGELAALSGEEKQGQVVTTIKQEAERRGITLAIHDAQALAKNAFLAFSDSAPQS